MNPPPPAFADAMLAARLFAAMPGRFGGIVLRGPGPARDAVVAAIAERVALRRLPVNIDDARLLGGLDVGASMAAGRAVSSAGLLGEAAGGALLIPLAERLDSGVSGRLAQAMDGDERLALIMLDDGAGGEQRPPAALVERCAFVLDLTDAGPGGLEIPDGGGCDPEAVAALDEAALQALAAASLALGVGSGRALGLAAHAARTHAALSGRTGAGEDDLAAAARLVLAPRATRLPPDEMPPAMPDDPGVSGGATEGEGENAALDDLVVAAAAAAVPPDVIEAIAQGAIRHGGVAGASAMRRRSGLRGRPLGARPGIPRGGARLALIDTLRAAVPWQPLRRREAGTANLSPLLVGKGDLRVRRFEERAGSLTVFCVDASGSAALTRLAEAKGAVELMLAKAYVKRSEVALVAFRGDGAELVLPPTRSLTRARRLLAGLPGGGGTPLAAGLDLARRTGEAALGRGRAPFLVVLTDGRGNVALDGTGNRASAGDDALACARRIAGAGTAAVVVDISPAPRSEAAELARAMRARYVPLPRADAAELHRAVATARG